MIRLVRAVRVSLAALSVLVGGAWLSACGAQSSTSAPASAGSGLPPPRSGLDSGVRGRVLIGPTCAAEPAADPSACFHPYEVALSVRTLSAGRVVARLRSSATGRFSLALAPGSYVLMASGGQPYPRSPAHTILVRSHRYTSVTIILDTGIRGAIRLPPGFKCANPVGCPPLLQQRTRGLLAFARDYVKHHVCLTGTKRLTAPKLAAAIAQELRAREAATWQLATYGLCNPTP